MSMCVSLLKWNIAYWPLRRPVFYLNVRLAQLDRRKKLHHEVSVRKNYVSLFGGGKNGDGDGIGGQRKQRICPMPADGRTTEKA